MGLIIKTLQKFMIIKTHPWVLVLEVMSARMHAHTGQLHRDHVVVEVELVLGLLLLLADLASSYLVLLLLRALALPDGGELHGDEAATWGGEESNPLRSGYLPLSESSAGRGTGGSPENYWPPLVNGSVAIKLRDHKGLRLEVGVMAIQRERAWHKILFLEFDPQQQQQQCSPRDSSARADLPL